MNKLTIFKKRLEKIDIKIEMESNIPWVYLHKINGEIVKEKYQADHGFTVAFSPIRKGQELKFTDLTEIFKLIRKYIKK